MNRKHFEFLKKLKRLEIRTQISEARYYQNLVKNVSVYFIDNLQATLVELQKMIKTRNECEFLKIRR